MRKALALVIVLGSTAALAQTAAPPPAAPPTVGGKPLVQVKPKATKATKPAPGKPQSIAVRLQACLEIEDGSKGRLDCYDATIKPAPKPKPPAAKGVMDCRFIKEEDERLTCFNNFAESIPKLPKN